MPSKVKSYEGKGVSTLLDWASGGCHTPDLLLWWLLLCRQRIGDQKRPVFDDFSPCRESHGEYFPVGIKSRAVVWRKLGLVHFLAFLWLLLCRQRNGGCFYVPRESGPARPGPASAAAMLAAAKASAAEAEADAEADAEAAVAARTLLVV